MQEQKLDGLRTRRTRRDVGAAVTRTLGQAALVQSVRDCPW